MKPDVAPPVTPAVDWRFPEATDRRLDNGLRVLAYHCPGQFVVSCTLLLDVSLNAEPTGLEGVATLTGRSLSEGAAGRSADEFADALARLGADSGAAASTDAFAVRLWVPATELDAALGLLWDAVTRPNLIEPDVLRQRQLLLQEIDHARAYPQHVAGEELDRALFQTGRAALPVHGTPETVAGVGVEDVRAYAGERIQPAPATLVLAGDYAGADPIRLAASRFADWRHPGSEQVVPEVPRAATTPRVVLLDWPDAPQATVRIAGPGLVRRDPRWPAMFVANYAIGGSFTSRLNTVLREQKGFTYGIGSGFETTRNCGVFTVSAAVRSDSTVEALDDIVSILTQARDGLTGAEVSTATRAVSDSAVLAFERADAVVGRVEMLLAQGLPLDHVDANLARIRRVTTEAADVAYREVVQPSALTVVVAADTRQVRDPLEAWGYGPVTVVSPTRR